jgi:O-antigen ligase
MGIYYLLLIMSRFHSDPRVGAELFDAGIVFVTPVKVVGLFAVLAAMLLTPAHNAAPRRANLLPLFFVAFAALPIILTLALGVPTPSASISSLISYGLLLVATRLLVTTDERVLKVIRVMVMASALGSLWVFRQHFMQDLDRPGGIEQDPNYEALTLVMGIPLAIWLIRHELGKWWRREAVVSLVLMTFATLLTQSRGGLIALGVLGIAAVFYSRRKILTLTVLAAATAILVLLAPAGLNSRFQSIRISGMPSNGDESATRTRVELVVAGMNMIRSHPFLGIGLDNFKSVSNEYNPALAAVADADHIAHNTYIQIAAEGGLPTLAIFLALLVLAVVNCRAVRRSSDTMLADLAIAMQLSLLAFVIGAGTVTAEYVVTFWLIIFISQNLREIVAVPRIQPISQPATYALSADVGRFHAQAAWNRPAHSSE